MTPFTGLTWDHPRGRDALRAAGFDELSWEVHPLEGFESTPIENLAELYDLIVLDHPHLGDALAADCLRPLDELFTTAELAAWAGEAVGPSGRSYELGGRTWALPLDAATQVSARRPELLAEAPVTWAEALTLDVPSAPSLAGPHAFLSFCSIAVSLGGDLRDDLGDDFFSNTLGTIERSWVRPRFAGYVPFQEQASTIIRDSLYTGDIRSTVDTLTTAYRKARS